MISNDNPPSDRQTVMTIDTSSEIYREVSEHHNSLLFLFSDSALRRSSGRRENSQEKRLAGKLHPFARRKTAPMTSRAFHTFRHVSDQSLRFNFLIHFLNFTVRYI